MRQTYRVYVNGFADEATIWSVDSGTVQDEVQVRAVRLINVSTKSRVNLRADNVREPKAWVEVYGRLYLANGEAQIYGD